MWELLQNKKEIISTIIGDKKMTEEEILASIVEALFNDNN
jgi:glycine betaine/choline ABC-type transport system substrate-binding protein